MATADRHAHGAFKLCRDLEGAGIALPAELTEPMALAGRLFERRANLPSPELVTAQAVQALLEDPEVDLHGRLLREPDARRAHSTVSEAIEVALGGILHTMNARKGQLTEAIRDTMFNPAADALAGIAEQVPPGYSIADLVRSGEPDAATARATADGHVQQVRAARKFRARLYGRRSGVEDTPFSLWDTAEAHARHLELSRLEDADEVTVLLAVLGEGGRLKLRTLAEIEEEMAAHPSTEPEPAPAA